MSFRTSFPSSAAWQRGDAVVLAVLVLSSVGLYAQTLAFEFVSFDTPRVLLGHPQLFDETSFLASVGQIFGNLPREEPLVVRDLSWALDARVWGFENPAGYHFGNLIWNAIAVALLYAFVLRSLASRGLALGVAMAFAVLPIHAEPVAWVMGRKDLLAASFMLAALLAQGVELETSRVGVRRGAYLAGWIFTGLALGSKISAVALCGLLALHRVCHPAMAAVRDARSDVDGPARSDRDPGEGILFRGIPRALLAVAPHTALSLGVFVWYRGVLHEYGVIGAAGPPPLSAEHLSNVASFLPWIGVEYLKNLVWPFDLSAYYRWPHVGSPLTTLELVGSGLIAVGTVAAVGALCIFRRELAFFALWPFVLMAPYSGLFYVGFWRADRYFYLASAGVLVVAAWFLREGVRQTPAARIPVALLVLFFVVTSGALAWQQQQHWRDNESLWSYEANREAPSLFAIHALAKLYTQRAEAAQDPASRHAWARKGAEQIARGFARRDTLALRPGNYRIPEILQEARLYGLSGRIGAVVGAPVAERLAHFRRSFEAAPDRRSAILLSQHLYDASVRATADEREPLLRESLETFVEYIRLSSHDPRYLAESEQLFERNFAGRFPFLNDEIQAVRAVYYP